MNSNDQTATGSSEVSFRAVSSRPPELANCPFPVGPELKHIPVEEIEAYYHDTVPPEYLRMYLSIVRRQPIGSGSGWFGPCQSRYSWEWLSRLHEISPTEGITPAQFRGDRKLFDRLDRNHDGLISSEDLDWSDSIPWLQHAYAINRLFRRIESNGDGRLTRDEWISFFDRATSGRDEMTLEELRDAWLSGLSSSYLPGDAPTNDSLLAGLFNGELGSCWEGPQLDAPAPDFCLPTLHGEQLIQLSKQVGPKPIVLVFGNFTCGPFRAMYPGVDAVYERFCEHAQFFAVYVREAHPTDGWHMCSNEKVGVKVSQPKSNHERTGVAGECHRLLRPAIRWLVDDITDSTGNAYSGMPARLYVVDTNGRIAYKSGRGPFGFKIGEMEQALCMTLLDGAKQIT